MLPKQHLSASQVNMYLRCPRQYYYRYVEGIKLPPRSAMTFGKATHSAIEFNLKQKKETREDLKLNDVQEYFAATFEELASETEFAKDEDPGQMKDEGIVIVSLHHTEVAPKIQPIEVEEEFIVEFENADYVFKGFIDTVDEQGFIRDTKTANRRPAKTAATQSLQLTAYALGYRLKYGEEEKGLVLDYLVRNKKPVYVPLEDTRTQRQIDRFLNIVGYVAEGIKTKLFFPNVTGMLCSEQWCGYWDRCNKDI